MLNEQEQKKVEEYRQRIFGTQNMSTKDKLVEKAQLIKESQKKGGFIADLMGIGTDIKESFQKRTPKVKEIAKSDIGLGRQIFQTAGQVAGFGADVIGSTVVGGIKALTPESIQKPVGEVITGVAEKVVSSDPIQSVIQKYQALPPETQRDIDAVLGIGSLATELTGFGIAGRGAKVGMKAGKEAIESGVKAVKPVISQTAKRGKELVKPTITPQKAVEEILGGRKDIPDWATKTLQKVNTTKVKTFDELEQTIKKTVNKLQKQVDTELGKDTTKIPLKQLTTQQITSGGQTVKTNYVQNAISHLKETYSKSGDAVLAKEMDELLKRAKTEGLTKLEVNNLARKYGSEFKEKSFGKIGEPLTSVSAKLYETTRKGLKDVARGGLKGSKAEIKDQLTSRLLSVNKLIAKQKEAVSALRRRIEDRGILEKLGHGTTKVLDMVSGGAIRGVVGGLLPRGVGYKTLNALDLEKLLQRNLKIIREANKANTPKQVESILNKLRGTK